MKHASRHACIDNAARCEPNVQAFCIVFHSESGTVHSGKIKALNICNCFLWIFQNRWVRPCISPYSPYIHPVHVFRGRALPRVFSKFNWNIKLYFSFVRCAGPASSSFPCLTLLILSFSFCSKRLIISLSNRYLMFCTISCAPSMPAIFYCGILQAL